MIRTKLLGVVLLASTVTAIGVTAALPSAGPAAAASAVAPANAAAVQIVPQGASCPVEFCFLPTSVTVFQAGTVTWTNKSSVEHTVTRCSMPACPVNGGTGTDPAFNDPLLPGAKITITFHGAGTYVYYCQIHGYLMHGTVTVKPFAVSTAALPAATVGKAYSTLLATSGGLAPIHWSIVTGALPKGLVLSGNRIAGTPTTKGTVRFTVEAKDSSKTALVAKRTLSIAVA